MKNEKIVMIIEATTGGVRKHVVDLCLSLNRLYSFEILLIYSLIRANECFLRDLNLLKLGGIKLFHIDLYRGFNLTDFISYLRILFVVSKIKPSIMLLHGATAGIWGRLTAPFSPNIK
jgi:hypothetical protein